MNIVSKKAANLIGSEILRLAQEVNQRVKNGESIFNLTIGDFDPKLFPIPDALKQHIVDAYTANETNYPPADGVAELKNAIRHFYAANQNLTVAQNEVIVGAGGRPLIYSIYQSIVDPGDVVVYPTPSWNNNHYCFLVDAVGVEVPTKAENAFMPTAEELRPHLSNATLLALCSPLNPTGTGFRREALGEICELVLEENKRRQGNRKPLYVLFDQIYWLLRAEGVEHADPVSVRPAMKDYTLFVDGISKSLSATGVRVGWTIGPASVVGKMKSILGHIGAWAPRAEQVATAKFLIDDAALHAYLNELSQKIRIRFDALYDGLQKLSDEGFPVRVIRPEGAIYVSAQFDIIGKHTPDGRLIATTTDITTYMLNDVGLAIAPFTAFGCADGTSWFRISVGTLGIDDLQPVMDRLKIKLLELE